MPVMSRKRILLVVLVLLALAFVGYAAAVNMSNGSATKDVVIVAGMEPGGAMYFRCAPDEGTPGVCANEGGHATVGVRKGDRVRVTVRTDDGKPHSHDFRLMGAPYMVWPAGIEMELHKPQEQKSFVAYAAGEYRFVCELAGHEDAGMWGTLRVA